MYGVNSIGFGFRVALKKHQGSTPRDIEAMFSGVGLVEKIGMLLPGKLLESLIYKFFYRVLPRNCCFLLGCWMRCFLLKLSLRRFRISDPGQVSDSERALFEKNQRHHTHTVLFLVILIICSGLEDST